MVVTPDGGHAYVTNSAGTTVSVISTVTNSITGAITGLNHPLIAALTPDGGRLYVTVHDRHSIDMLKRQPDHPIAQYFAGRPEYAAHCDSDFGMLSIKGADWTHFIAGREEVEAAAQNASFDVALVFSIKYEPAHRLPSPQSPRSGLVRCSACLTAWR